MSEKKIFAENFQKSKIQQTGRVKFYIVNLAPPQQKFDLVYAQPYTWILVWNQRGWQGQAQTRSGFLLRWANFFWEKNLSFQNKFFRFLCSFFSKKFSRPLKNQPTGHAYPDRSAKKIFGGRFHPKKICYLNFFSQDSQGTKNAPQLVEHAKFRLLKTRYMGPLSATV